MGQPSDMYVTADVLFHFFKIDISDFFITFFAAFVSTGIAALSFLMLSIFGLSLLTGLVHLFRCGLPNSIQFGRCFINGIEVFFFMCILQVSKGFFDWIFLIGRDFITKFLQLLFRLERSGCRQHSVYRSFPWPVCHWLRFPWPHFSSFRFLHH